MNITPEMKAQLAEQKKQCIHCKLISGEQPGVKTIFQDNVTSAMLDIYPFVKGHASFMTKEHYPMPAYIPGNEFSHLFALIPELASAMQKATVSRGFNVFVAVGGAAGQSSPHFLVHLLPRDPDDHKDQFSFKGKESMDEQTIKMLAQNMPIMMKNHFGRHPNNWHTGKGNIPSYLGKIYEQDNVVYEDEQVLCVAPKISHGKGHLIIYSKDEEKDIRKLSQAQSSHFFFAASFASTAIFEGMKCHATNIVLKSGQSTDNPSGRLAIHVFGRWQGDGLETMNWKSAQTQDNLDPLQKEIKSNAFAVKYKGEKKVITSTTITSKPIAPVKSIAPRVTTISAKKKPLPGSVHDEILKAIERAKK